MTENKPYTPTTQQVRDAVLMSGKPFDQIVEIDDPVEGYSIHDQYVEPGAAFARWLTQHDAEVLTAARPSWVAESREALVDAIMLERDKYPRHRGDIDSEELVDALIANGVVTLANPAEVDGPTEDELFDAIRSMWTGSKPGNSRYNLAWDAAKAVLALLAPRAAPAASQGDTPADEEWVSTVEELDALPQDSIVGTTVAWKARNKAEAYGGGRFWTGAANDRVATKESHQMTLPIRVLYRPDQKPAVPVDALGFPTQEGATFTATVVLGERRTLRFRVVGLGRFRAEGEGGTWGRVDLDIASIEDVRTADDRSGQ